MLQNAQQYVWTSPALAIYPGVVITLVVLAYNFLGDGLRAHAGRIRRLCRSGALGCTSGR